jgi:Protein of unknown function (DUF3298)/Deacetylase PdaC
MKYLISLLLLVQLQSTAQTATSWFKTYSGTIGKSTFTMLLHKAGNDYDAYVYFMNTQQPYHIAGQNQKAPLIILTGAPPDSEHTEKWQLKIVGKNISGSFIMNKKTSLLMGQQRNFEPSATYVFTEKKERLNPADKTSPEAIFYQSGIWYTNNSAVNKLLWPNCIGKTAGNYFLENRDAFINAYKKENKALKPADYKDATYMYSQNTTSKLLMSYVSQNLLVFSADSYEYSGGAHGNYGTGHWVIDMRNEKLLSIQDVITDTAALSTILEKNFRKINKVPANQSLEEYGLFVNSIPVTNNFFLTQKCLGFTYNPYEIGPYAAGQITITIPFEEFKHLITDFAKDIFTNE